MPSGPFSPTRRELLLGLAGAALAYSKVRNSMYNPQLAAHTSIWRVEAELRQIPDADILEEAFVGTHRAGYGRVELISEFLSPELRAQTLRLLGKNNLEPSILFTGGSLHEREAGEASRKQVMDLAWLMMGRGTQLVNFSPSSKANGQPKTNEELDTEAYQLNRMGEELQREGIALMLHHHEAEMRDGAREWRYMLAHTETSLVSFCLDVDWVTRAGIRPVSLIDTAGPRLRSLHLRNPKNGMDQELLGDGDINMPEIARLLRQMSYDGFLVVELLHDKDTPRQHSLATDLSVSRFYMQEVFGARPGSRPVEMGPYVRQKT
jgi:inosose dehydratase